MATHSNILAWEIPLTEEPGWLQSMGLQIVGYDLATKPTTCIANGKNKHVNFECFHMRETSV